MRKLYIKQKLFNIKQDFYIKDENGQDVYQIDGKLLNIGRKVILKDNLGNELAVIQQEILHIMPHYNIWINDKKIATVRKKFTILRPQYLIDDIGWTIQGDVLTLNYSINDGNQEIAKINKKIVAMSDTYEVIIERDQDEIAIIAVVMAIDAVKDANESAITDLTMD